MYWVQLVTYWLLCNWQAASLRAIPWFLSLIAHHVWFQNIKLVMAKTTRLRFHNITVATSNSYIWSMMILNTTRLKIYTFSGCEGRKKELFISTTQKAGDDIMLIMHTIFMVGSVDAVLWMKQSKSMLNKACYCRLFMLQCKALWGDCCCDLRL